MISTTLVVQILELPWFTICRAGAVRNAITASKFQCEEQSSLFMPLWSYESNGPLEVRWDSNAPWRCSATMKAAMDVCSISAKPSPYSPGGKLV